MDVEQARPVSAADSDSYGTAQFLRHCLNLLNHAGAASDTASQLVAEVQSWGISLDKSVATSRASPSNALNDCCRPSGVFMVP